MTERLHFHALEKEMQPTPVFLPGESQGRGSLVGCCLWGRTESDTTEVTWRQQQCVDVNLKLLIYLSISPRPTSLTLLVTISLFFMLSLFLLKINVIQCLSFSGYPQDNVTFSHSDSSKLPVRTLPRKVTASLSHTGTLQNLRDTEVQFQAMAIKRISQ